ncbi:DHA1 family inner membrane transport protein [Saccharothrix tamanrassetensis]|uniref:DHA1 family inner membrane transport protein n=1 Tax=Saccharothrix tamanrassetensis TaxID=1051531 RepID=A0A841CV94_9PSEU|nr:MFS transporter [Saccharothrix tamanrassetensis]MBB5959875.1 DHA1 family inner membrane transport protein [Saccharothrix tamanrassetensis]
MIAFVLMLCAFAVGTSEFIVVGVLPEVASDLDVALPTAGLLVTAYAVSVAVGGPVLTVLTGRLPRRSLLIAVMVLALLASSACALAGDYTTLMAARMVAALSQGLFFAVASQVAVAAVPPEKQTAAIAKVVNGVALSTILGIPIGTLIGQNYGWRASFALVAALTLVGLVGVLLGAPKVDHEPDAGVRASLFAFGRKTVLLGLATTVLSFTGMITAFTYVAPALRDITGFSPAWVTGVLLIYGLGTIVGSTIAGRVPPGAIAKVLPIPLAALTVLLLAQGFLLETKVTAIVAVFVLGASAFASGPLLHTFLMGQAGSAAGLVASVNISAFNVAAALGPMIGGVVITSGLGLQWTAAVGAVPTVLGVLVALLIGRLVRRGAAPAEPTPVTLAHA